jgi:hypothetical protein
MYTITIYNMKGYEILRYSNVRITHEDSQRIGFVYNGKENVIFPGRAIVQISQN